MVWVAPAPVPTIVVTAITVPAAVMTAVPVAALHLNDGFILRR